MGFLRIRRAGSSEVDLRRSARGAGQDASADTRLTRFYKLIPAETLALYPAGLSIIPPTQLLALWVWAWFCLVLSLSFRLVLTADPGRAPQWIAVSLSVLAFAVWVHSIGQVFGPYAIPPNLHWLPGLLALGLSGIGALLYSGSKD